MRHRSAFLTLCLAAASGAFTPYQPELLAIGGLWLQDRPVQAIATGYSHAVVLSPDSTVFAWGANDSGQTDIPSGLGKVVAIKAGGYSSAARTKDGRIVVWGASLVKNGVPDTIRAAKDFVVGDGFGAALMPDSTLVWWGNHTLISRNLSKAKAIKINADGQAFSVLLANGDATAWENQRGDGAGYRRATPSNPAVDVANGAAHIVVLHKDSTVSCSNRSGERALDICPELTGVVSISAAYFQSGALTSDGTIRTWGVARASSEKKFPGDSIVQLHLAQSGNLAVTRSNMLHGWNSQFNFGVIDSIHASDAIAIGVGWTHSLVLHRDGRVTARGRYTYKDAYVPAGISNVKKLVGGMDYSAALLGDGSVVVWGDSLRSGILDVPAGLTDVVDIAGGYDQIFALMRDGTLRAWGRSAPEPPNDLTDVVAMSPYTALKKDGSIVSWGFFGTEAPKGNDFVAVTSTGWYAMALRKDGTVVAWPYISRNTLFPIPNNLTDVVSIAVGDDHALALKKDGSVVAWGSNSHGQTNIPKGFKARAIYAGYCSSWLLRDTSTTTATQPRATPPAPKAFESGMYLVYGMDGVLLWKGELRNASELSRFQSRGRILFLRRVSSGDVMKIVNFGRN